MKRLAQRREVAEAQRKDRFLCVLASWRLCVKKLKIKRKGAETGRREGKEMVALRPCAFATLRSLPSAEIKYDRK